MTAAKERSSALRHLTLVQAADAVRKGEVSPSTRRRRWRRPRASTDCARRAGCSAACTAYRSHIRTCTTGRASPAHAAPRSAGRSGRPTRRLRSSGLRGPGRSPSGRSTWRSSRRTRPVTMRTSATATTPGMSTIARVAPLPVRVRRSPPASSTAHWGPTPVARFACQRPCAA
jgi:hypothetical protein